MNDRGPQTTTASAGLGPLLPAFTFVHDLRQPLRAIVAAIQRILQQPADLSADAREQLQAALQAAREQDALMAAALEYESARAGEGVDSIEMPFFLALQGACVKLEPMRKNRDAEVRLPSEPVRQAVPAVLRQVLEKLLHNALKFHRPSERPQVSVAVRSVPESGLEVRITDNGLGIDARYREKVFEPFARLNSIASYPGAGLSLATCRCLLASSGGSIDVEDRPDGADGTTFVIRLAAPKS